MGEVMSADYLKLVDAVRIWSNWGNSLPDRSDGRLIQQLGPKEAYELLPVIKQLEQDFYKSDARYMAATLQEMAQLSRLHFNQIHPALPAEISEILAWCYTYDFK